MSPDEMESRIRNAYPDCDVAVLDSTGSQNHFDVRLATEKLNGLSRVQQHQAVMSLFSDELKSGEVHALAIQILKK